jgi:hypothetical protein
MCVCVCFGKLTLVYVCVYRGGTIIISSCVCVCVCVPLTYVCVWYSEEAQSQSQTLEHHKSDIVVPKR